MRLFIIIRVDSRSSKESQSSYQQLLNSREEEKDFHGNHHHQLHQNQEYPVSFSGGLSELLQPPNKRSYLPSSVDQLNHTGEEHAPPEKMGGESYHYHNHHHYQQLTGSSRLGLRNSSGEIVEVQGGHIVRSTGFARQPVWNWVSKNGDVGWRRRYFRRICVSDEAISATVVRSNHNSQLFNNSQRRPLQSSNAPSFRAWIDPSLPFTIYQHPTLAFHCPSSMSGFASDLGGFSGFRIPARIQGEEEEHDGISDKPSSTSSDSHH